MNGQCENCMRLLNLSAGFPGKRLVERVYGRVCAGELTGLIGANGVGKSTLLRTIGGELPPLSGRVELAGCDLHKLAKREIARKVSLVTTENVLAEAMTVREVVGLGRYPHTGILGLMTAEDRERVAEAMDVTGVGDMQSRNVATLSDGERQKVMIARAIAQQTPFMLLDEPTAFLDVASRVEVIALLGRLAHERGVGIVMSLHDLPSALGACSRIWALPGDGTLVSATPGELLAEHKANGADSTLGRLFAGRNVRFDPGVNDFVYSGDSSVYHFE